MKNLRIIIITLFSVLIYGQEKKELITSQISVSGEGVIRTVPDQGTITIGVVSTKSNPKEAKEENDIIIEKILKFIKKQNIPESDFQTTHVNLNKNYDYQKKTYHYVANKNNHI